MRRPTDAWPKLRALLCVGALAALGCAGPGVPRPVEAAVHEEGGFTLTERVRVSGSARSDFEDAIRALEERDHARGIALLLKVTEAAPGFTTAHIDLGMAYGQVEDWNSAAASLERAIELSPQHPVALNELGIAYRNLGRFAEARASYERALASQPSFHFARRNLAILCDLYLGDVECALKSFRLYQQAAPDDPAVAMWIADLESRAGS